MDAVTQDGTNSNTLRCTATYVVDRYRSVGYCSVLQSSPRSSSSVPTYVTSRSSKGLQSVYGSWRMSVSTATVGMQVRGQYDARVQFVDDRSPQQLRLLAATDTEGIKAKQTKHDQRLTQTSKPER